MIIFTPNTVIRSTEINSNFDDIKTHLLGIKAINSNFTITAVRFTTTSASYVDVTNCSFNYTSGTLTETLVLNWSTMSSTPANVGEMRLLINDVQVGTTIYQDSSSNWVRANAGCTYSMPANTTYAMKLQAKVNGGSTYSITTEVEIWKPTITGIAIPVGVI